uniref:ATP synthase subunit delta, chloroplastic n=1 Tax=Caulacanthus okamurae TaxID=152008 RepID=A0A6H1U925_9FLOR|nr:ATP synthase delta subunit [Caulacanthus okamurae]QIZ74710.1 ATP synthase delta subunit [Caulacanthus okamurae]
MNDQSLTAKIVLPYAEALLEYARDNQIINEANQNLSAISDLLSRSKNLKLFLDNPLIAKEIKKNVIKKLFSTQINNFLLNFLLVLVDRRRVSLLDLIIDKYFDLVYKLDATIIAQISTAIALNEAQQQSLINKLKIMTDSKQVKLKINIDISLIAGFTIQIGSKIIDTSLSGKLRKIALYLDTN